MKMLRIIRSLESNRDEISISATIFNMLVTIVTVLALICDSWMTLESRYQTITRNGSIVTNNNNNSRPSLEFMTFDTWPLPNGRSCDKIGTRQFWYPARFGRFSDQYGRVHISFHYNDIVMVDCITPNVANLFYVIISLSFIGMIVSFSAGLLTLFAPSLGFLLWLRRNTVLELLNLLLISLALMAAVIAQLQVTSMHPHAIVNVGTGMYLITAAALLMFSSIGCSIRHHKAVRRIRRIENKKFICSRALRSWRDFNQRPEDMRPIIGDPYFDEEPILMFAQQQCQTHPQGPIITSENPIIPS